VVTAAAAEEKVKADRAHLVVCVKAISPNFYEQINKAENKTAIKNTIATLVANVNAEEEAWAHTSFLQAEAEKAIEHLSINYHLAVPKHKVDLVMETMKKLNNKAKNLTDGKVYVYVNRLKGNEVRLNLKQNPIGDDLLLEYSKGKSNPRKGKGRGNNRRPRKNTRRNGGKRNFRKNNNRS